MKAGSQRHRSQLGQSLPAVMVILLLLSLIAGGVAMGVSSALSSQRMSKRMALGDLGVQSAIETAAAGVAAGGCGTAPTPSTPSALAGSRLAATAPGPSASPSPNAVLRPSPTPSPARPAPRAAAPTASPTPTVQPQPLPTSLTAPPAPPGAPQMLGSSCARIDHAGLGQLHQQLGTLSGTSSCVAFSSGLTMSVGRVLIWLQTMRRLQTLTAWLTSNASCSRTAASSCIAAVAWSSPVTQLRLDCPWATAGNAFLGLTVGSSLSPPVKTVIRWAPQDPSGDSVAMLAVPIVATGASPAYEQADLAMTTTGLRLLFEGELQ